MAAFISMYFSPKACCKFQRGSLASLFFVFFSPLFAIVKELFYLTQKDVRVRIRFTLSLLLFTMPAAANTGADKFLEQSFATAMLLTNGESVSLGVGHFNSPLGIVGDDSEVDPSLRQDLNIYTLPYHFEPQKRSVIDNYSSQTFVQGSYMRQTSDVQAFDGVASDVVTEQIFGAGSGILFERPVSSKWNFGFGLRAQLFDYENEYRYNSAPSRQQLKPVFEGQYANISSVALIANPIVQMKYKLPRHWGYYEYTSQYSYYFGNTLSQPDSVAPVKPEGWRFQNGIRARFDTAHFGRYTQAIYVKAHRVDIGADNAAAFATDHFYEYGVGVLVDVDNWLGWVSNVGLGFNYHHGSQLEGGSIVFYFNE